MNNLSRDITAVVDVEEFPPVVCVVDLVSLSVELAGQEVEQLLRLPAQEGEPVLKYCQITSDLTSVRQPTWSPTVPEILYFSSSRIISSTSVASWPEKYTRERAG